VRVRNLQARETTRASRQCQSAEISRDQDSGRAAYLPICTGVLHCAVCVCVPAVLDPADEEAEALDWRRERVRRKTPRAFLGDSAAAEERYSAGMALSITRETRNFRVRFSEVVTILTHPTASTA